MGMNYYAVKKKPSINEPIHIGKSSAGWRFLFHEIDGIADDWDLQINTYPQWKEWLEKHIGKDYVILNEEDEMVKLNDLLKLIENKQKENNPDNFTNARNVDGYRFTRGDFS